MHLLERLLLLLQRDVSLPLRREKIVIVDLSATIRARSHTTTTHHPHKTLPEPTPGRALHFPGVCRKMGERKGWGQGPSGKRLEDRK